MQWEEVKHDSLSKECQSICKYALSHHSRYVVWMETWKQKTNIDPLPIYE